MENVPSGERLGIDVDILRGANDGRVGCARSKADDGTGGALRHDCTECTSLCVDWYPATLKQ